ncbi:hypothetical protein [Aurantiacibacter atlanticus]|uniref:hypothetical protein n=1 Tax=Aurantiacibacter atlanticus TaxID=1648404 RepID=UPI00069F30BB|nr:hypothetical protein [Aurantiacibacter atlanticus]
MKFSTCVTIAALLGVCTIPASAQDTAQTVVPTSAVPVSAPIQEAPTANAVLRSGTPVQLRFMETVTTKDKAASVGQRVQMEVAAPIEVNGVVVIPAGSPAWGEITSVRNKGMWGKSGKLEGRALFARVNGRQIRLSGTFDDKGVTVTAGVVGAIALVPVAGFFMTGTSAELPLGGEVGAFIDEDVELAIANTQPGPMVVGAPAPAPQPVVAADGQ